MNSEGFHSGRQCPLRSQSLYGEKPCPWGRELRAPTFLWTFTAEAHSRRSAARRARRGAAVASLGAAGRSDPLHLPLLRTPPSAPSPPPRRSPRRIPVSTRCSRTTRHGRSGAVPGQSSASRQSAPPLRPCFYVGFPTAAPLYVVIFRPIYFPTGQKHGPGRIQLIC